MNQALQIQKADPEIMKNPLPCEDLSALAGNLKLKPDQSDVIEMAGDLLGVVCMAMDIEPDFDGVETTILKDQETGKLKALILSPVDMHAGEPFARYQVNPQKIVKAKTQPKILLPN